MRRFSFDAARGGSVLAIDAPAGATVDGVLVDGHGNSNAEPFAAVL